MTTDDDAPAGLVEYRVEDGVCWITLNRPEKLNALNTQLLRELRDALYRLDSDDTALVGILSGEGRAFCSGADLRERVGTAAARGVTAEPRTTLLLSRFLNYKPIIAAVHGFAVGAGLIIVLQADYIVADTSAKFQIVEVLRGLDGTSLWEYLRQRVPGAVADDLAMTGRICTGEEAARIGLANRLAPEGCHRQVALEVARELMALPPLAIRTIVKSKRGHLELIEARMNIVLRERFLQNSSDYRESVDAMREGREPKFKGR